MKRILYSLLFIAGAGITLAACSNGDYNANPGSNANSSVNPLTPLTASQLSAFVTSDAPSVIRATIDGSPWSSGDSSTGWLLDSTGTNIIVGFSGNKAIELSLKNVYAPNIYGMGYKNIVTWGQYAVIDTGKIQASPYFSYSGNSGEVQILENDSAYIKGTFYFQGIDAKGNVTNVNNGYFYILKHT